MIRSIVLSIPFSSIISNNDGEIFCPVKDTLRVLSNCPGFICSSIAVFRSEVSIDTESNFVIEFKAFLEASRAIFVDFPGSPGEGATP